MKKAVAIGLGVAAAAAGVGLAVALSSGPPPRIGDTATIKARDGSSHRLQFAQIGPGRGWLAQSSDTANRFQQGEKIQIDGRSYAWQRGLNAFVEVA
jgi:hypothetical protein